MAPEDIALVKNSWRKVLPIADQAAELFYGRLFEIAPEVKPLFKAGMKEQGRKLFGMLGIAVGNLDDPGVILKPLEDLAIRHVSYGVRDEHYDVVGHALLWTLEQGLGDDFTPEVKAAWAETYVAIAGVMKKAGAESVNV